MPPSLRGELECSRKRRVLKLQDFLGLHPVRPFSITRLICISSPTARRGAEIKKPPGERRQAPSAFLRGSRPAESSLGRPFADQVPRVISVHRCIRRTPLANCNHRSPLCPARKANRGAAFGRSQMTNVECRIYLNATWLFKPSNTWRSRVSGNYLFTARPAPYGAADLQPRARESSSKPWEKVAVKAAREQDTTGTLIQPTAEQQDAQRRAICRLPHKITISSAVRAIKGKRKQAHETYTFFMISRRTMVA